MVQVNFDHVDEPKKNKTGRRKGCLNKKTRTETIFRQQMENHFEKVMKKDFAHVLKSTVQKAKEGDMAATKMLFDRVIPVGKAIDFTDNRGTPMININIGNLTKDDNSVVSEQ
jgi:hypothetical protein